MFAASKTKQVSSSANFIESCFATYLYTGNGGTQSINNGIDLAGKGGLTWIKRRSSLADHYWCDTVRGAGNYISSSYTLAQNYFGPPYNGLTAFNSNGFTLGSDTTLGWVNNNAETYASWTFRKQAKFFDVVTWTGDGTGARTISHNLGSTPGCMIVKRYDTTQAWSVYHRGLSTPATSELTLNATSAEITGVSTWNSTNPTSTQFSVDSTRNANGGTFIAYLFAHNAGGFGLTGTDNVISCGSFTTDGSGNYNVNLGYEPQWIMMKRTDTTGNWFVFDIMRGMCNTSVEYLYPNLSNAAAVASDGRVTPTATGFYNNGVNFGGGATYIYIAIRRGPMQVPTDATKVFYPAAYTNAGSDVNVATNFNVDFAFGRTRSPSGNNWEAFDRLRGATQRLNTNTTGAEVNAQALSFDVSSKIVAWNGYDLNYGSYNFTLDCFQRAPNFFDEVCFTGTGNNQTLDHNLGAVPELIIYKRRSQAGYNWEVGLNFTASDYLSLQLNTATTGNGVISYSAGGPFAAQPTSTQFTVGQFYAGSGMVSYLFATCTGVSKVGSYTGTGATQTISCGFTGGARFVLIKRTDSTGNWEIFDTARGMVAGTDPHLELNTTNAETNANWVYTTTGGFQIVTSDANVNASGGSYIFLAVS